MFGSRCPDDQGIRFEYPCSSRYRERTLPRFAMSAKKKNQHFVPRHYLRRFSFDGGKRIRVLKVASGDYIPEAGLKGQCAGPYFYHTDPGVEASFAEIEGAAEGYFKRIVNEHWLPNDGPTKLDIFMVLNLMHSRTEIFGDQTFRIFESFATETLDAYLRANNRHDVLKYLPRLRFGAPSLRMHGVRLALTTAMLLFDLRLKLLIPPSGIRFMTSDHPVVLLNQAFVNVVRNQSSSGLAMRGLQVFLPLSPELLLLAFDQDVYRVGRPERNVIKMARKEDVDLINALQVMNSNECLYFRDEEDVLHSGYLLSKFRNRRPRLADFVEISKIIEGGREGSSLIVHATAIPLPGIWSFCKMRKQAKPADFCVRNTNIFRLHGEYAEACNMSGSLLPFMEWLDEKAEQETFWNNR
jgi:hypothetical protein